jgi:hypothetical protein
LTAAVRSIDRSWWRVAALSTHDVALGHGNAAWCSRGEESISLTVDAPVHYLDVVRRIRRAMASAG